MKIRIMVVFFLVMVLVAPVFGRTPTDILLFKDMGKNQLRIKVYNPTRKARQDYVEKIEVIVDDSEPIIKTFNFQKGPYQSMVVIIEKLKDAKEITVVAYPKAGQQLEKTFVVDNLPKL